MYLFGYVLVLFCFSFGFGGLFVLKIYFLFVVCFWFFGGHGGALS